MRTPPAVEPPDVIEIVIEEKAWRTAEPRVRSLVRVAAVATLKAEGRAGGGVAVLLAADSRLQALNAAFRGKDSPTNVLSFPGPDAAAHLGDIWRSASAPAKPPNRARPWPRTCSTSPPMASCTF